MSGWSYFPRFTERILTMGTEKRTEGSELEPPGIQFPPLLVIGIFLSRGIPLVLSRNITVLNTEASDIHSPVRDTADSEIKTG